uniref:Galectin n=1 Tax=Vombatus ursinus TaxID=29139 RepID=A0A4X2K6P9_VOMUR
MGAKTATCAENWERKVTVNVFWIPSFRVNLGKDEHNLALHFNPRFNACDDTNTIICNSRQEGTWGTEQRETNFPFLPGSRVRPQIQSMVCIKFEWNFFVVRLPDGHYLNFPNRTETTKIDYVQVIGDFVIRTFAFE